MVTSRDLPATSARSRQPGGGPGHGGIEILINYLGIFEPKPFEQISDSKWIFFASAPKWGLVPSRRHHSRQSRSGHCARCSLPLTGGSATKSALLDHLVGTHA
jgi:hypothetical protein